MNWRDQHERDLGLPANQEAEKTQGIIKVSRSGTRTKNFSTTVFFIVTLTLGVIAWPILNRVYQSTPQQTETKPNIIRKNTKWEEFEKKGFSIIRQVNRLEPEEKLAEAKIEELDETLLLFEKDKDKFKGVTQLELLFSQLTRIYVKHALIPTKSVPGFEKGSKMLEAVEGRLKHNFEEEDPVIANECQKVIELREELQNKIKELSQQQS